MENESRVPKEYYVVDLKPIMRALWKKAWLIAVVSILVAAVGLFIAAFAVTPQYASSIMLYVNNSSLSLGNTSIDVGSLTASRDLVETYIVILSNRTTLEMVIDEEDLPYTYEDLSKMLNAEAVGDTQIMRVTVTTEDPYEAARIANSIAKILPARIAEIIEGSSMKVVDAGVPDLEKVSPSISKYTIIGFLLGMVLSCGVLTVTVVMDDTIHGEDYIAETYSYPLLAVVPDLLDSSGSKEYSYYRSYGTQKKG